MQIQCVLLDNLEEELLQRIEVSGPAIEMLFEISPRRYEVDSSLRNPV
jgi:hypothetical protein